MYKKLVTIGLVLTLCLASATVAFAAQNSVTSWSSTIPGSVAVQNQDISFDENGLAMNVDYPQLSGMANTNMEQGINDLFQTAAIGVEDEGYANKVSAQDYALRHIDGEVFLAYSVTYNSNDLLSISFDNYQYDGGANGTTTRFSYTVNTQTGQVYDLGDLFRNNPNYVATINHQIELQLKTINVGSRSMGSFLLTPFVSIPPNQGFYLTDNALVVYFQQGEYFPQYFGITVIAIPLSDLPGFSTASPQ